MIIYYIAIIATREQNNVIKEIYFFLCFSDL